MKYELIIDRDAQESVIVTARAPSALTQKIEDLVRNYAGADSILGFREDELRRLQFFDIECITILDRKVMAIDRAGKEYRIQERLRDLEQLLPSYFIRINKSTLANSIRIRQPPLNSLVCRLKSSRVKPNPNKVFSISAS